MSKSPDLSAFPIPRKGRARPLSVEESAEAVAPTAMREVAPTATREQEASLMPAFPLTSVLTGTVTQPNGRAEVEERDARTQANHGLYPAAPVPSGQTVATTVKLDEGRYLRLAEAGKPGPGRLKRRTIQDIMVEALDEWFERRNL